MTSEIWKVLDLAPVRDRDAIRRAYARRLKVTSPEDDAEGFQALREAYEEALASLDWDWAWEDDDLGDAEAGLGPMVVLSNVSELQAVLADARRAGVHAPAPPAIEGHQGHEDLLGELEGLVNAGAEPAALEAALAAVLASPAMEDLNVEVASEQRILQLIAANAPRSDALVRPAINAFGLKRDRIGPRGDGLAEAVLNRDADIVFRDGLRRHEGQRRTAFLALTRTLDQGPAWHERLWPGFEKAMRDLILEINHHRYSLRADIDLETLAFWEARLDRPRLSPTQLWLILFGPVIPTLAVLLYTTSLAQAFGAYLYGATCALAAMVFWSHALLPLRRTWRDRWEWRAPLWARIGWWPASLALLVPAAFAEPGPWTTLGIGIWGAAIALWAAATCDVETRSANGLWPLAQRILIGQAALVAWAVTLRLIHPEAMTGPLTVALAVAALVSAAGTTTLPIAWFQWLPKALRVGLVLALIPCAAGAAYLALRMGETPALAPWALAATAAVILAHRPAAGGLDANAQQWRARAMMFSISGLFGLGHAIGLVAASCLWFLFGTAVTLVLLLFMEKDL